MVAHESAIPSPEAPIFSRITDSLCFAPDVFSNSKVLRELTNGNRFSHKTTLRTTKRGNTNRSTVRRSPAGSTGLDVIVKEVMSITHPDIDSAIREGLVDEETLRLFFDHPDARAYHDEVTRSYCQADLLRGMDAFSSAELEHYNGMYQPTLIEPATRFAEWLIAVETRIVPTPY